MFDWVAIQIYLDSLKKRTRNPKMEPVIAKNGEVSYLYALRILHSPFPKGEPAIAKCPVWAVRYARFIIKKRFFAAEKYIARDPESCYNYYKHVIKRKLPKKMHESMILMSYEKPQDYYLNKYFSEVK